MMMDHIKALFNSPWHKDDTDDTKILGTWAEDDSTYEIIVPPQLRDLIIIWQNHFYKFDYKRTQLKQQLKNLDDWYDKLGKL